MMHSPRSRRLREADARAQPAAPAHAVAECRVPARPSELQGVRERADAAAAAFGLGGSDRQAFVFAVNEAVTNAIRHGRPDSDGTIGVRIEVDGDTLICSVSDSGRFLPGPSDRDPLAEGGRGLACVALVMDRFELSTAPGGTTVRLYKRRAVGAAQDADWRGWRPDG